MRISVVTPSFNQGPYIERCLQSVRLEEGLELEHIILDNCSTDQTSEILARYHACRDGVRRRIIVEADNGQTAAINRGFSLATGEILCWLNTDEYFHDGALASVAAYFDAHPDVDVVFGDCDFVNGDGRLVKRRTAHRFSRSMLLYYGCYISSCATFFRRRVIDQGELLDTAFKVTMDFEYYMRLIDHGFRFAYHPQVLASFTWHDSNISSTFKARRQAERLSVQRRHSAIAGPAAVRDKLFAVLRLAWIARRMTRRMIG